MTEIIWTTIWAVLGVVCLIISILQFNEKGFLFNNAYIWASKQERENMDKKPHYRQSGIVFALCAAILLCLALETLLSTGWLWIVGAALTAVMLVYAIASSAKDISA